MELAEKSQADERAALRKIDQMQHRLDEFATRTAAVEEMRDRISHLERESDAFQREIRTRTQAYRNLMEDLIDRDAALVKAERAVTEEARRRQGVLNQLESALEERNTLLQRLRDRTDETQYLRRLIDEQRTEAERFLIEVHRNATETQRGLLKMGRFFESLPSTAPSPPRKLLPAPPTSTDRNRDRSLDRPSSRSREPSLDRDRDRGGYGYEATATPPRTVSLNPDVRDQARRDMEWTSGVSRKVSGRVPGEGEGRNYPTSGAFSVAGGGVGAERERMGERRDYKDDRKEYKDSEIDKAGRRSRSPESPAYSTRGTTERPIMRSDRYMDLDRARDVDSTRDRPRESYRGDVDRERDRGEYGRRSDTYKYYEPVVGGGGEEDLVKRDRNRFSYSSTVESGERGGEHEKDDVGKEERKSELPMVSVDGAQDTSGTKGEERRPSEVEATEAMRRAEMVEE